ncbi:type IV pili methyl-accepting chemotaxis transducer N-terminal domain-containing protein [Variovorax sp. YR216]|uniref:type IV pili methyl-accepting chemotaxis transducer N-terminal domain-containing protein n=1 Tax=Variovorax sp. YR216 TaxID=1882828 RepID=UPI00089989A9|nr:type IV pili methyl-accepting chemotaxis transducer N-terminal domain-containing protein [Variovorax sp. YR216]SEB24139.1 two-component system, NarL family, nitrate/nitrite sensor histidine kinase NarX [Variovorax sp. YR216]
MRRSPTLVAKLGAIGGALLLAAIASIGLTLWMTWQLEGGAAAINEAGRMRMQTWRLAQAQAFADPQKIGALSEELDRSIALLRQGDPARPLFVPRDKASLDAFDAVEAGWTALRRDWSAAPAPSAEAAAGRARTLVEQIDRFVSQIEGHLSRLTAILNAVQLIMVALVVASAVAILYLSYLLVFNPLARLQAGLTRIRDGDLSARVEHPAKDEFGALADGFNRMAETLQDLYQGLESKVQEKTMRLEAEHARLAALYKAAAFVNRAGTLEELAQGFAQQIRAVAEADASAIRWSDESNHRYIMLASDGLPRTLTEDEYCLPTGDCFCGQDQAHASTQVIPIVAQNRPGFLGHCTRAGYGAVVSVPVRLQERLVGELNLFYREPVALADDDRALLETLASHLAGAIEGLRGAALQREAAIAEERGLLARELHDSIAQSLAFLKIQIGLLRGALKRGESAQADRSLAELDAGVNGSLSDVRELLVHFRTRTNAEDIIPAIQITLQKFEHQTGLPTHLAIEGQGLPLAADVQVQVLHVVQEALSNVRKHSGASAVWVEVRQSPPWRVEVRDDGRGFVEPEQASDGIHVGLRIMRERAHSIGAEVEVHSVVGAGTSVVMTLPVAETQPPEHATIKAP